MESENAIIDMIPPGKALDTLIWDRLFNRESLLSVISDCSMFDGVHSPFLQALVGFNAFSTSDLEAMFVVQAMMQKSDGMEVHSSLIRNGKGGITSQVSFININTGKDSMAEGETLAHAVCLAALKYVGLGDYEENGVWPGKKVYFVKFEDAPTLHEGRIVEGYSNRGTFTAEFTPDDQPPYESLVTREALDSGLMAFTPEKAIKYAFEVQFDAAKSANLKATRASEKLALIRKLGK